MSEERRVDPSDGGAYTLQDIGQFYMQRGFGREQIEKYWREKMKPWIPPKTRFEVQDRVMCNMGERRFAGVIISKNVDNPSEPGDVLPYVVKTDNYAGIAESRTISVPSDTEICCMRERCFNVTKELDLVKWSAPIITEHQRKKLRFSIGDAVAIRVEDTDKGYEQWELGKVSEVWPRLPEPPKEGWLRHAEAVPYRVQLEMPPDFYCHRDDHTLIRKPENVPKEPGRTIAKRFEKRKREDGTTENFDHLTLRSRIVKDEDLNASDSD